MDLQKIDKLAGKLVDGAKTLSEIGAVATDGSVFEDVIANVGQDFTAINEFFDSEMTGEKDKNLKKLVAAAAIMAKHTGSPVVSYSSPEELAGVVDQGFTQMKAAYKTAGEFAEMSMTEAIEALVDRAVARAGAAIDRIQPVITEAAKQAVDVVIPKVIYSLGNALESFYPPSAPVVEIIKNFAPVLSEKLKPVVEVGVPKLCNFTKKMLTSAGERVKKWAPKILKKVLG